jgi:hypothetical protein
MQQYIKLVRFETAEIGPLLIGFREARPAQCSADAGFESKFNGVAAQVNSTIVTATLKKHLCVPKMPSRHATEYSAQEHGASNGIGVSATGFLLLV